MTDDDEVLFVLVTGGMFFGLGFIFIVGQLYLACFQLKKIIGCLSNSRGVLLRKPLMDDGVFGVFFMLICIGAFFMFPSKSIRCGNLDENDYLSFPRGLLSCIKFLYAAGVGGGVAMFVLFFGGKYMGWIE
ncbi:hypothetical protein LOY55_02185 [Pseudomonas sp. B21-040]|uniref:hypothetical protein n=1 Tax=unclassified Pseudomonas TaxID=196821 RepID=UPI001CBEB14F|nr:MULTISPECIES: hypothetical protein [unclassified Pseudomonas]UVL40950.1 hypothetical protein LOY55_02185 [Pseudomonas sp. B21-040]